VWLTGCSVAAAALWLCMTVLWLCYGGAVTAAVAALWLCLWTWRSACAENGGVPVVDDHQNEKGVEGIQDVVEVVELEVIPVVSEQLTTASVSRQSPPIVEVDNQSTLNTRSNRAYA